MSSMTRKALESLKQAPPAAAVKVEKPTSVVAARKG